MSAHPLICSCLLLLQGRLRANCRGLDWGGGARNSFALFVRLKMMGNGHSGSGAAPRRSRDSGAFGSLCQFSAKFVYLGICLGRLGLGRENKALLFPPTASASRAATTIFLSLTALAVASFTRKGVSSSLLESSSTSIATSSPEIDAALLELERSSGEWRENWRGNRPLTLLFAVTV